jgi:GNAT superfamily N-acetyltransferase
VTTATRGPGPGAAAAGWLAILPGVEPVIAVLPAAEIDRLEPLWAQLLAHHSLDAEHLAALGAVRSREDSWRVRRAQYLGWLAAPPAWALVARAGRRLLGYAVVRVVDAPGTWQWGDQAGVLETLVVDDRERGTGVGQALLQAARDRLAGLGIAVLKISVIDGNDGAMRFYQREGAVGYETTLVMPVNADRAAG